MSVLKQYNHLTEQWEYVVVGKRGLKGDKGDTGLSAYELAVAAGYSGTLEEWLLTATGPKGDSAYALAVTNGFAGTESEWLASLKGVAGKDMTHVSAQVINVQTGTTYTLQATDAGATVTLDNTAAITVTVPANVFATGQRVDFWVLNTGMATFVSDGVLTLEGTPSKVSREQFVPLTVFFISPTYAVLGGGLATP